MNQETAPPRRAVPTSTDDEEALVAMADRVEAICRRVDVINPVTNKLIDSIRGGMGPIPKGAAASQAWLEEAIRRERESGATALGNEVDALWAEAGELSVHAASIPATSAKALAAKARMMMADMPKPHEDDDDHLILARSLAADLLAGRA